jgi:hypothetical protein
MAENSDTVMERRLRGALPDGFQTGIYDTDRLRQLSNADTSNLGDTVDDYGNNTLDEAAIINTEVQRVMTALQTPERTIELPMTGLAHESGLISAFASKYKSNQDTPSGTIKDARRAGVDDIVFTFATPEVYDEVSGTGQSTFEVSNLSSGNTLELVDQDGLPAGGETGDTSLSMDDDEMMFFTGDYIDLSEGQSAVTKIQWSDIDGDDYGPDDGILSTRLSGTHYFAGQGAWIKSSADLDAKVYADGDAEIVPIAFYMGPGSNAPSLV